MCHDYRLHTVLLHSSLLVSPFWKNSSTVNLTLDFLLVSQRINLYHSIHKITAYSLIKTDTHRNWVDFYWICFFFFFRIRYSSDLLRLKVPTNSPNCHNRSWSKRVIRWNGKGAPLPYRKTRRCTSEYVTDCVGSVVYSIVVRPRLFIHKERDSEEKENVFTKGTQRVVCMGSTE